MESHVGDRGHVYDSHHADCTDSRAWHTEGTGTCCSLLLCRNSTGLQWAWWVWANLTTHSSTSQSPRMTREALSSLISKARALSPHWMEVSSGKSIPHSLSNPFTLNHNVRTIMEWTITKLAGSQRSQVYSWLWFAEGYCSASTKQNGIRCFHTPFLPFQSLPRRDCSPSHTPRTHRSTNDPSSTPSASHNPSAWNDNLD